MIFDDGSSKVGLGDAILRLINVRYQRMRGIGSPNEQNEEETAIILEALNQYELHISFVCEIGDEEDTSKNTTIDIIKKSAETKTKKGVSCCRIKPKKLTQEELTQEKEQLELDLGIIPQQVVTPKRKRSSRRKK